MAVWPVSLPAPAVGTVFEAPAENTIRSTMDKGPAKLRRRTTANCYPLSFSMWLTADDVETLKGFYDDDTFSGSESFSYTHPRTGETVSARFMERPSWQEREGVVDGDADYGRFIYAANVSLEIEP